MTIGIRVKIDPSGLRQKCILGDFPQLLELPLLKTNIGGCFQSVREAALTRTFTKHLAKQTLRSPFKVKLCENLKNSYFPIHIGKVGHRTLRRDPGPNTLWWDPQVGP